MTKVRQGFSMPPYGKEGGKQSTSYRPHSYGPTKLSAVCKNSSVCEKSKAALSTTPGSDQTRHLLQNHRITESQNQCISHAQEERQKLKQRDKQKRLKQKQNSNQNQNKSKQKQESKEQKYKIQNCSRSSTKKSRRFTYHDLFNSNI